MRKHLAMVMCALLMALSARPLWAQPPQAYEDCRGKRAGDQVMHLTREGRIAATCEETPQGLAARPIQPQDRAQDAQARGPQGARQGQVPSGEQAGPGQTRQDGRPQTPQSPEGKSSGNAKRYSIEQAVSDQAQLHTIAFDALAFLTGDFASDTFLPPGKVSDYFGFQYMRDIDAKEGGHNTSFLTRIALNMLSILNDSQKARLLGLAKEQEKNIRLFAERRLPLIKAFRRNLEGDLPPGAKGLDREAVMRFSAGLYELDGKLSFERAEVMAGIIRSLSPEQKAGLAGLKFGDSRTWPDKPEQLDKRSMSHEADVAVMTYASEMFSWYAGSLEADTYFCPERHGMYFGGFGLKTAPAMGKQDYSISTALTGDSGEDFLSLLSQAQRKLITDLLGAQRQDLTEIVKIRQMIAAELRRFLKGETASRDKVLSLSRRYGELDGEMSWLYATAFAKLARTLSAQQSQSLARLRLSNPSDPKGPFLYSTPIQRPNIGDTDFLFSPKG